MAESFFSLFFVFLLQIINDTQSHCAQMMLQIFLCRKSWPMFLDSDSDHDSEKP